MRTFSCGLAASVLLCSSNIFAQQCTARLLVSGYVSNNVHVYDACTGEFQTLLDSTGTVPGAQTTRVGPDGLLYVVAEKAGQVRRYRTDTLAFVDTFINVGNGFGATGMDFGPDGDVYVAGYEADTVRRFDRVTGAAKGDLFPRNSSLLNGPDNGMRFGPDGRLYIPGYDSHNVVVHSASGLQQLVAPRAGGLFETRGLLFEASGDLLVTGEGSGQVLRVAVATGQVQSTLVTALNRPTGITYGVDGSLLVVSNNGVLKRDPTTGAARGNLVAANAGGLSGATFITLLPNPQPIVVQPDSTQIGSQYWVVGNAPLQGKVVNIDDMLSATGTVFGPNFDPAAVVRKRWGSLRLQFTACDRALVSWTSTGTNSANFGDGGYELIRLLDSAATVQCRSSGFDQSSSSEWLLGAWYHPSRSGEGFLLDKGADGTVFVAWFTHRPG